MRKIAIACDVDGTLWAGDGIFSLFEKYGKRKRAEMIYALSKSDPKKLASQLGIPAEDISPGIDAKIILEEIIRDSGPINADAFEKIASSAIFFDGVRDFFRKEQDAGSKMFLLSTGYSPFLDGIARRLGLSPSSVCGTELVVAGGFVIGFLGPVVEAGVKAEMINEISKRIGIPISSFVGIGDSASDKYFLREISQAGGLAISVRNNKELLGFAKPQVAMPKPDFGKIAVEVENFRSAV